MCLRKKEDNARSQPKKESAGETRAPSSASIEPSFDAESHADSVESTVIDCKVEQEIDTGNEKLNNRAVVEASNNFATRLMNQVFDPDSKSVCISPISISFVLAMSLAGAKGDTEAELVTILGNGSSSKEIEAYFKEVKTVFQQLSELDILHNTNRIYYDHSIELLQDYEEKVTGLYGADSFKSLKSSNSRGTAKEINAFVKKITKGNLGDVITAAQVRDSPMILLNALYFRGKWKKPFDPLANVIHEFTLLNERTKKTEMMTRTSYVLASDYFYYENDEMQRICLPYENLKENGKYDYKKKSSQLDVGEISMYIFLPLEGLQKLVKDLDGKKLLEWLQPKPSTVIDVKYKLCIKIPKITIRADLELKATLQKIGLKNYFSENADFSGISDAPLQPSRFIHETFIKTDELGTEASATTLGGFRVTSGKGEPEIKVIEKKFHADRPFLYAIVSQKQHVLFIGTVMDVDEGNEEELKKRITDARNKKLKSKFNKK